MRFPLKTYRLLLSVILLQMIGCQSYAPVVPQELSRMLTPPKPGNPIFVKQYDHEFLWSVLTDVIDSHFDIAREMPIRLYGNVLTEGYLETKPKIGASLGEPWHADSVGFAERLNCTLQTIRRRVEVHTVPEVGGFTIEVKVFKDMEDNDHPLRSVGNSKSLRFQESAEVSSTASGITDSTASKVPSTRWYPFERDAAMEERLLQEILYRLAHPPEILRKSKTPVKG